MSTAEYIYKTLFLEEKGSDITVLMLGKAWKLHKVYISQSPYFASMFSGAWREANESKVNVEISDPNITLDSLTIVCGSFYQDEINVEPKNVVSVLATATLFQLQGLIDQCTEIMIETINMKTAVSYYNASVCYGVPKVKVMCKRWLEFNLLEYGKFHDAFLTDISPELMTELVASPDLVVMQTEFCIYVMLRVWLFQQVQHNYIDYNLVTFYKNHPWTEPYLETQEGEEFSAPFEALRKKHLLLSDSDIQILYNDNLIPENWLYEAYKEQWLHILRINSRREIGPRAVNEQDFANECFRCARCVERPGEHLWRWTAFHYGLDLVVTLDATTLKFKRYNKIDSGQIKANHDKHYVMLRICLFSLNEQRQIKYIQNSGLMRLSLQKNEEKQVLCLNQKLSYPLYVSVNLQVVTGLVTRKGDKSSTNSELSDT
ncbi:protein germ cell-less isoform X2 [Copidosoma floridanum]|nr:protein germ cell-less isoform X2 [Copidosoma floridanum]